MPSVVNKTVTPETSNVSTHNFSMPAGLVVDRILIGVFTTDATETISNMQSGWTQLYETAPASGGTGHAWYRKVDGTETDGTYDTGTNEQSINVVYQVRDWHGTTAPESVDIDETTSTPDPPSITPSWGTAPNLWMVVRHHDGAGNATDYPDDYVDNNDTQTSGSGGSCSFGVGTREVNATSQDPNTFTFSASDSGVTAIIAIRDGTAGGGGPAVPALDEGMLVGGMQPLGGGME